MGETLRSSWVRLSGVHGLDLTRGFLSDNTRESRSAVSEKVLCMKLKEESLWKKLEEYFRDWVPKRPEAGFVNV